MQILVVDDEPNSREIVKRYLQGKHEVLEASTGPRAWEIVQREKIKFVITDWMMPGMDGLELIRRIRAANAPGYTYIILLTALDSKPNVISGLGAGADDYLTKPFDPDELLARVVIGERILRLEENLLDSRQQMEYLAMHDSLTGLLNRRAVQEHVDVELSRARRERLSIGLIMLDIDHFKDVNDRYGHDAGDQALREVASALTQNVRAHDWVGRWGGEEFLLILPETTLPETLAAAERIRASITNIALTSAAGEVVTLRASLGVTNTSGQAGGYPSADQFVRQADEALYQAKREGRNRVCVYPS